MSREGTAANPAPVTIVVVPRERFSYAEASLENILANTDPGVPLVYVDGGSPLRVRHYLKQRSRERGFKLLRTEHYLAPNEARNLGAREARGRYVVFVDNDVATTRGWLNALTRCAEETGASLVGPVYCIGAPEDRIVHMAGGEAHIREQGRERYLHEWHRLENEKLETAAAQLRREPTEVLEFHCLLVRRSVLDQLGPLDEGLLSVHEHVDLCMSVRKAGGTVYLEPGAVVTYVTAPPFSWSDLPYYLLRWSDAWCRASYEHINAKWSLTDDHYGIHERFVRPHRHLALLSLESWFHRLLGRRLGGAALGRLEQALVERGLRKRARAAT